MLRCVIRIAILGMVLSGACTSAFAQRAADARIVSLPEPVRPGGLIRSIERQIARDVKPGACLAGTFMSSDIMALGVPGVRVSPQAMFWPHHATPRPGGDAWNISRTDDAYILARLRRPMLAVDILREMAKYQPNSDFHFYYAGADLIARFGFASC